MVTILQGRSLEPFRQSVEKPDNSPAESIGDAMVAAKTSIGSFGGALRRLIYRPASKQFSPEFVRHAQCLTEQVSQQALSAKGGTVPMGYHEYGLALKRLLQGEPRNKEGEPERLREMLNDENLSQVWDRLRSWMPGGPAPWQRWLQSPHDLADLLAEAEAHTLDIPATDLRVRPFLQGAD